MQLPTLTLMGLGLVGFFVVVIRGEKVRYDNYKVYRIIPKTEKERYALVQFMEKSQGVQFLKGVHQPGEACDVMVPPNFQYVFEAKYASRNNRTNKVLIENIQTLIDEDALEMRSKGSSFNWKNYSRLSDIYKFYDKLAKLHPKTVKVLVIGKSTEGRDLKVVRIRKSHIPKPVIWYDSNVHAREWITSATCTYVLDQLLNSKNPKIIQMTLDFNWYIMCMANPDGFEYSHEVDRMWRKTRSKTKTSECYGVDPNRNWDYKWMTGGSSDNPCNETYAGPKPFSEPETKAISKFYTSITDQVIFYLSVHSYGQMILLPYGYSAQRYKGYEDDLKVGKIAAKAFLKSSGTVFQVGKIIDLVGQASGSSIDWVKGVYNTSLALGFELRDKGDYGFLLPANQIIPSCMELLDALIAISEQLQIRLRESLTAIFITGMNPDLN